MYYVKDLDKRICDVEEGATNTQTFREWINDISLYIGNVPYTDEKLNNLSDEELTFLIDELDWLSLK